MCLAIPGLVEEIFTKDGLPMAKINFAGMKRAACLAYVPKAKVGNYVLIHVGFAISILDEQEAQNSLASLKTSGEMDLFKNEIF